MMKIDKEAFERAVAAMKSMPNYGGTNADKSRSSGGDIEEHYALRDGRKVVVAKADHLEGLYEIDDSAARKVIGDLLL